MEYSKKEIEYHKQKLIEARRRVEEACKEDDNSLDVVCNMMGLTVDRYKSVHGIVKIVHYPNKSITNIIKIAIGNNHYEHIEQLTGKYGLYNELKIDMHKYLIRDINAVLIAMKNFSFILLEHDLTELSYLIKANTDSELQIESIVMLLSNYTDYLNLGNIVDDYNKKSCILYNRELYEVLWATRLNNNKCLVVAIDNTRLLFISNNMCGILELEDDLVHSLVDSTDLNISELCPGILGRGSYLIDTNRNKIYYVYRGFWERRKDKFSKDLGDNRYLVSTTAEYIGVIIESDIAVYDTLEGKMYWSNGDSHKYTDKDDNEFKGYENSGSGYDEPFKMIECNYTYKEVTKEGILAELKDYNIG